MRTLEDQKKYLRDLSKGNQKKVGIVAAMMGNPQIIILDEPFANIDPLTIYDVKQMIRHLTSKNISVLITDHNAREVSSIVDHSYLIQDGRVTHSGTISDLKERSLND